MQNAGLAALGLNWRYLAFEVEPENLPAALQGAKAMNFTGLNLTIPHKLLAVGLVDVIDESAKAWGAVNTIVFEGRDEHGDWQPVREFAEAPRETRMHGFNTDADAITRSIREDLGLELRCARVLLLGAGGAGRTAALKLSSERVSELFLVNRTRSKADAVATEIRERHPDIRVATTYPAGPVDLVLNATSLGLKPGDAPPFDERQFSLRQARAVYDMIYRPAETALLKAAKAAGCRSANGLGMLLYQGAKALELWAGQPAPLNIMRQALTKDVYG
jgi:shikimate dehydrogenase